MSTSPLRSSDSVNSKGPWSEADGAAHPSAEARPSVGARLPRGSPPLLWELAPLWEPAPSGCMSIMAKGCEDLKHFRSFQQSNKRSSKEHDGGTIVKQGNKGKEPRPVCQRPVLRLRAFSQPRRDPHSHTAPSGPQAGREKPSLSHLGISGCSVETPPWSQHSAHSSCTRVQSCPTLCDPTDCSPPGSSVRGILQARVLEWGCQALLQGSS